MSHKVGFLLVTHNKPHQFVRLVDTLNRMFDYPPIACHHNFSISSLPLEQLPPNIKFVHPHVKTRWGKFSTIEAELKALELMYESPDSPDWFILLSGSDYPIKSADTILHALTSSPYDVCMHHELVDYKALESNWQKLGYQRYCIVRGWVPSLDENLKPKKHFITLIEHPSLTKFFIPFSEDFPCFVGDHFFCANRDAAKYLLDFHRSNPKLATYYQKSTIFPTESYYQTIFCNSPHLKVENNNWRYIDWSTKDAHPKILLLEDLPQIQASTAHFARKFDIDEDAKVLDELDALTK
jgi:hypothetical protein